MIKFYRQHAILPDSVDTYVEPFFGGGAMFLYALEHYQPRRTIINDVNPGIVGIYTTIRDNAEMFVRRVSELETVFLQMSYEDRKKFYYDIRHQHAYDYEQWSKTQEAATLFFLMKTGFNGLWQVNNNTNGRFGTPCGLLKQTGQVFDRDNVQAWHQALQTAEITCGDWRSVDDMIDNAFYFLDPPYRGSFTSYGQSFTDTDQEDLVEFAKSVPDSSRVLLCNDNVGDNFFEDRQGHLKMLKFEIKHTAGRRKRTNTGHEAKAVTEIVLHNAPVSNGFSTALFE